MNLSFLVSFGLLVSLSNQVALEDFIFDGVGKGFSQEIKLEKQIMRELSSYGKQ